MPNKVSININMQHAVENIDSHCMSHVVLCTYINHLIIALDSFNYKMAFTVGSANKFVCHHISDIIP
jgi:hypothetical protein